MYNLPEILSKTGNEIWSFNNWTIKIQLLNNI
jgi:hypothetical protein